MPWYIRKAFSFGPLRLNLSKRGLGFSVGAKGARIGVLRDLFGRDDEDKPAVALIEKALETLKAQGATVVDPLDAGVDLWAVLRDTNAGTGEYRQAINAYFATRGSATPVHNLTELIASGGYLGVWRSSTASPTRSRR